MFLEILFDESSLVARAFTSDFPRYDVATAALLLLFGATMFLSALLLFWIQLVIAKMLLPRLGGTPAVWNTCMLFFQVLLLAGIPTSSLQLPG